MRLAEKASKDAVHARRCGCSEAIDVALACGGDWIAREPADHARQIERGGGRGMLQPYLGQTGVAGVAQTEAADRQRERGLDAGALRRVHPGKGGRVLALAGLSERFVSRLRTQRHQPARRLRSSAVDAVRAGLAGGGSVASRDFIKAAPHRIHTVLTDLRLQFTSRKQDVWDSQHIFDRVCDEHDIEHRLTKVNHPWTNGQVERMNRTIKDATVKRFHYDTHDQLRAHLQPFVDAYNHARRLKTLRGLTPYEFICQAWTKEPDRFRLNPSHLIPGPYT